MKQPDGPAHQKIVSLAVMGYKTIFCPRTGNQLFNQPITG
jgi:hypothetical protein